MHIAFPFNVTNGGLAATADDEQHIRQLIEQLLFTLPGERVNRPDFGTSLSQLVFSPGSIELATATQFLVQGALQQWLGNLIQIQAVQVVNDDAVLSVTISYIIRRTQQQQIEQFVL